MLATLAAAQQESNPFFPLVTKTEQNQGSLTLIFSLKTTTLAPTRASISF